MLDFQKDIHFFKEGFEYSLENAVNLHKIAKLSSDDGQFGIACALNVLAAEEAVKANFILVKQYNPDTEINDFEKIFRKHLFKHEHIKGISALHEVQIKRFKIDLEMFEKFIEVIKQIPESHRLRIKENFSIWNDIKDAIKRFDSRKVTYTEISLWADNANDEKNNGFYVDLKNEKWITPKSFTRETYIRESKYTAAIIDYVRNTEKIFSDVDNFMGKNCV